MIAPLVPRHMFDTVCKIGQGADCCRYLLGGADGIECGKHQPEFKRMLDARHAAGTMVARGDNCEGLKDNGPLS